MGEDVKKTDGDHPDLDRLYEKSTEKIVEDLSKNELIEKQNVELKRLVRLLPFQIFILVAHADELIDPKEIAQFKEILNKRKNRCTNQYTLRMYHATVLNFNSLTARYYNGQIKKDFSQVEKTMNYIRMCVPQSMIRKICDDLSSLAVAIARASGGFLGMTSPVSKEEQEIIDRLDEIFQDAIENAVTSASETKLTLEI